MAQNKKTHTRARNGHGDALLCFFIILGRPIEIQLNKFTLNNALFKSATVFI